jgi:tRNA wybutosine-synthesizing protein 3
MTHPEYSKDFDLQKKLCLEKLYKPDKSRKGTVDAPIIELIDYINNLKNYYTTSSCSGRIQLLTDSNKKPEIKWLYVSHELVDVKNILNALSEQNLENYPEDRVWLRQETLIFHIACRTMDDARAILKIARDIGLIRSGIIADSNIIIVEICSTEKMDVPVVENGKLVVTEEYLELITKIANQRFSRGRDKLIKLESEIKEKLKN